MKIFLILAGIIAVAAGLTAAVASFGPEESVEFLVKSFTANTKGMAISGALAFAGLALMFLAGRMFGKGDADYEPPASCPDCRADVQRGVCPECGTEFGPPRYSLDTASLIGGILGLLCLGGMIGSGMASPNAKLLGILFVSALSISGVAVFMGLCSLLAERRKPVFAILGVVLSGAVLGTGIFLIL